MRSLPFILLLLAGCATQSNRTTVIEPAGLRMAADATFTVSVIPADPDDPGDFAEDYAADLQTSILHELTGSGFQTGRGDFTLVAAITWIAPGGAWGEEAECHLDVTLQRGKETWKFQVVGYSGSTWGRDRIPNALAQAARAVAKTLADARG
jgi:hypothetical protein